MQWESTALLTTAVLKQHILVRPPWLGISGQWQKKVPVNPRHFFCIGTHIHKTKQNTKTQPLKRWFQQAFNYHLVCFSVTGSESELFFLAFSSLKENIPSPKYGIHLHCNPKWRADSFPLDLCFTYSHSLLFLMDNEWKHSPVGISMRTKPPSETDVLETKLPVTVKQIIHSYSHSGPNCAVLLHVHL